jgi:hypothetical protein
MPEMSEANGRWRQAKATPEVQFERTSGGQKKKRARLVLTNCFGICPKDAVVTASPATFARGELILIRDCSGESIEKATEALS